MAKDFREIHFVHILEYHVTTVFIFPDKNFTFDCLTGPKKNGPAGKNISAK